MGAGGSELKLPTELHSTHSFNSNISGTIAGSGDTRVSKTDRTLTSQSHIPVEGMSVSHPCCGEEIQSRKGRSRRAPWTSDI